MDHCGIARYDPLHLSLYLLFLFPSAAATVNGFVWENENGDGIFREGDRGFANLIIILRKDGKGVDAHKHHAMMQSNWVVEMSW